MILTTYHKATEQGIPIHNIQTLIDICFKDWHKEYTDTVTHYHRLCETLSQRHMKELIQAQKKKALGQHKTHKQALLLQPFITLDDNPIQELAIKAQKNGTPITFDDLKLHYTIEENPLVKQKLEQTNFQFSEKTRQRVTNEIHDILNKSQTEGIGPRQVGDKIQEKFSKLKGYEAERIARTEINRANNTYNYEQLINDDLIDYYQWLSTKDHRTRGQHKGDKANHIEMNGEIVRKGEAFSNGLMFPGDPNGPAYETINCRCTLVPYIIPWDKLPPAKTHFKESDLVDKPEDAQQTFMLDMLESTRLVTAHDGGFRVNTGFLSKAKDKIKKAVDKLTQQTLDGYINNIDELKQKFHKEVTSPIVPMDKTKPTRLTISSFTKTTDEMLQNKTITQLTKHFDTQIKKATRRLKTTRRHIVKTMDKRVAVGGQIRDLNKQMHDEVNKYLQDNFDEILSKQGGLSPEEQLQYDQLIQEMKEAGGRIINGEYGYEVVDSGFGLIKRHELQDLHLKAIASKPPEYQEILEEITSLKKHPDIKTDPVLKAKLKKAIAKRKIWIKDNTPREVRDEAEQIIKEKYTSKLKKLEQRKSAYDKRIEALKKRQEQVVTKQEERVAIVEQRWIKESEKTRTKLSKQVKSSTTLLNGKEYKIFNKVENDIHDYRKLSARYHASRANKNATARFYTDDSSAFNKYIALKNKGAPRYEIEEVLDDEFYKEIDGVNTDYTKYKGITYIDDLEELFIKREREMKELQVPVPENTVCYSAQNLDYLLGDVGGSLPLESFTSTSLSKEQTYTFLERLADNDKELALVEFYVEEGTQVTPMLQTGLKNYMNEAELVLPPGVKNEIVDIVDDVVEISPTYSVDVVIFKVLVKR